MNSDWFVLLLHLAIVVFLVWYGWRYLLRWPLRNGERYFFGVEVPAGWHSSAEGRKWWRWYWGTAILVPLSLEVIGFGVIAIWGRWKQLPVLALITPVWVALSLSFLACWRYASGADRRKPKRVAVALEERRLSQYFSWPVEALMLLLTAGSWAALYVWGDAATEWRTPITTTYVVLAFGGLKLSVMRRGWPLPAERTDAYERLQEVRRRQGMSWFDRFRGFLVAVLTGYAVVHTVGRVAAIEQVRWATVAIILAVGIWMTLGILRWQRAVDRAEAGLPPAQMPINWRGGGWWSFGAFMAGLAVLLVWPW